MTCRLCGQEILIGQWFVCPHESITPRPASVHKSERAVYLEHPKTGDVRIPGRVDRITKMESAYLREGYERRELPDLASVRRFEKQRGLVSEIANYDNSGRAERDTNST